MKKGVEIELDPSNEIFLERPPGTLFEDRK